MSKVERTGQCLTSEWTVQSALLGNFHLDCVFSRHFPWFCHRQFPVIIMTLLENGRRLTWSLYEVWIRRNERRC